VYLLFVANVDQQIVIRNQLEVYFSYWKYLSNYYSPGNASLLSEYQLLSVDVCTYYLLQTWISRTSIS